MKQRRLHNCGMRDGTANDIEMNGQLRVNNSGWIVNHAGLRICRGKMATRKKKDGDFPTLSATSAPNDTDNNNENDVE